MRCYIVDIDGTVANTEHRIHYITNGHKDWKGWHANAHLDEPIEEMITILRLAQLLYGIVFCTGRDEMCREDTLKWFRENDIPFDALYMRKAGDRRDDDTVKYELLQQIRADGYDPVLVFDDRDRVVKMWRSQGLRCFQVQEGDF